MNLTLYYCYYCMSAVRAYVLRISDTELLKQMEKHT